jgi:hypothetical protein
MQYRIGKLESSKKGQPITVNGRAHLLGAACSSCSVVASSCFLLLLLVLVLLAQRLAKILEGLGPECAINTA